MGGGALLQGFGELISRETGLPVSRDPEPLTTVARGAGAALAELDTLRRSVDQSGTMEAMDKFHQKAWDIVTGPEARHAFDLDAEPRKIRERYGLMPEFKAPTADRCGCPAWSQRMLLARRLVEAGVRLVTVDLRWWDTHVEGFDSMKNGFAPRWDQAYTALIEDLEQRGLLESTIVLAWGEFGRTLQINAKNGRDHWPGVFSAAMAGGSRTNQMFFAGSSFGVYHERASGQRSTPTMSNMPESCPAPRLETSLRSSGTKPRSTGTSPSRVSAGVNTQ